MLSEMGNNLKGSDILTIPDNIWALIMALNSHELTERWQATAQLLASGEAAVEGLIVALRHESIEVRWRTAVALGWLQDRRAVAALMEALRDKAWDVRHNAVWALGMIGDSDAVQPLLGLLHHTDTEEELRYGAAMSLLAMHGLRAVDMLRGLRDDAEDWVMKKVINAALTNLRYET